MADFLLIFVKYFKYTTKIPSLAVSLLTLELDNFHHILYIKAKESLVVSFSPIYKILRINIIPLF